MEESYFGITRLAVNMLWEVSEENIYIEITHEQHYSFLSALLIYNYPVAIS